MSFGFSVGDCILLINIARTQYNNCVAAGPEYREIAREVKTLYNVLEILHNESSKNPSPLLRRDQTFTTQLAPAVNDCRHILEDLQTLLAKYEGLSDNGKAVNPTRKLWHKIRFGSKIQALGEVRAKIILYTTTINACLDAIQIRATGRLEDKLDATHTAMVDGFQSIKLAMVKEVLKAKALAQNPSTASLLSMSTHSEDDKEIWKEFRRELIAKGFKSKQLDRHKDTLLAYMLKLEQSGVLDEVGIVGSAQSWRENLDYRDAEMSPDLQPIEEEENPVTPPTFHQQLAVKSSPAPSSGSESTPRQEYEETPFISLPIAPSSSSSSHAISTFLHAVISHAILEGPQALEQTLDLYPQLLQDPYLDAAISAQPIPEARESLRTIVAKTRQFEREKEVIVYDYATLEEAPPDQERAVERSEDHEAERTEGLEIITKQVSVELPELKTAI